MRRVAWSVLVVVATSGCGESRHQLETKRDLMDIVFAYHNFNSVRGRSPHSVEELVAFEDAAAGSLPKNAESQGGARRALQSGSYVIVWDVEILYPGERNSGKILAYHRDTPEKGGVVGYQDGRAAIVSREEFERTPRSIPAVEPKK